MTENSKNYENPLEHFSPSEFPLHSDESRAAARALADGIGVPPSLNVTFVYGYATDAGFVDCDPDRERAWIQEFAGLKRAAGESWEAFSQRIYDSEPVGETEPSLTVQRNGVEINFDLVQKVRVGHKIFERLPGELWGDFEMRFAGGAGA